MIWLSWYDIKRYTTEELRNEFLIQNIFKADEVTAVYSHVDRMVTLGCMTVNEVVNLEKGMDIWHTFGTQFFLERREIGIFNVGGDGKIVADGEEFNLTYTDCVYITKGTKTVTFQSNDPKKPAKFYMVSAPAHTSYKTTFIPMAKANKRPMGAMETANDRVINQFIHPDVLQTCQLSMGLTQLKPGSVWNSMPPHTHERRMEVYFYFEVPQDNVVFHMMGQAAETRHIVMYNEEAVISPSWSMHCGAGTVLDAETARMAILNGAAFVVSPAFDEATIKLCNRYRVACMPGTTTIQGVIQALELGADIVKVFPGEVVGSKFIKAVKGPLPQAQMMPTGGVSIDNVGEWFKAGAVAVGAGGALTGGGKTLAEITETAKKFVVAVAKARK